MKKLKLDLEMVQVDSFATGGEKGRGTVKANSGVSSFCSFRPPATCQPDTCWDSCGGSCDTLCGWVPSQAYYNGACV
jgi:hypothetical protein